MTDVGLGLLLSNIGCIELQYSKRCVRQVRCQGTRVDYVAPPKGSLTDKGSKNVAKGRPAARSASPSKKTSAGKTTKVKKAKGSKKKKKK